jgi:hypothetical protein
MDLKRLFKQVLAAGAAAFSAALPIIGGIASSLKLDVAAGKAAILAALGSAGAALLAGAGNFVKQWWEKAHGYFAAGFDEAEGLLAEAQEKIAAARRAIS